MKRLLITIIFIFGSINLSASVCPNLADFSIFDNMAPWVANPASRTPQYEEGTKFVYAQVLPIRGVVCIYSTPSFKTPYSIWQNKRAQAVVQGEDGDYWFCRNRYKKTDCQCSESLEKCKFVIEK